MWACTVNRLQMFSTSQAVISYIFSSTSISADLDMTPKQYGFMVSLTYLFVAGSMYIVSVTS